MREIDKKIDNSIKRKKQMRTTTFAMALLVAAIMVSSTIPAMTVSDSTQMNENEGQQTQFLDEAISIAHDDFSGMNLGASDKTFEYSGQIRTIVIWNNGMDFNDGWTAQTTQCTYDGEPADDFMFDTATAVMDIHWLALSGMELNCNWYIRFFTDDGSGAYPGTMINEFYLTPVDVYVGDWSGYQLYDYTADLTGVNCNAGQKYWVSLQADFPCSSTRVFWCMHSYEWQLSVAAFRSDYFTGGIWRDSYYMMGAPYDMCFELTAKFDHDVGVTEIVSPVDYQEMCPCMPVTVKVGNFGAYDEVNVPVHVEITQSAPGFPSSFDEPFYGFWYGQGIYLWNMWYGSDWTDPAYVTPHTGYAMAKFDGTNGYYGSEFLYSQQVDFATACHPMMCFWMWHDTYSSDDYIQVYVNGQPIGDPLYRLTCDQPGWYKHCVDLGDYAGQAVQIAFLGVQDGIYGAYNLYIDDVNLYDALYDETVYVDIDSGQVIEVELPDFCPCQWNLIENTEFTYTITATTEMIGDENIFNDGITTGLVVYYPFYHDVGAISIDSPTGQHLPAGAMEMCSTIKNFGQYQECCFNTYISVEEQYLLPGFDIWTETWSGWSIYYPNYYYAPYPWIDQHKNIAYYYGWEASNSFNAGGSAPEAYLPYYYCVANYVFYTPFSTVGLTNPQVDFKAYINHYSGQGLYTLKAGYSYDTVNWVEAWSFAPSSSQKFTGEFNLPAGQPNLYVGWWVIGNPFYFNYYYLDDIHFFEGDIAAYYPAEWTDKVCVEQIDVCQELQLCFSDWTPAQPWPDCGTKTYRICSWTNMCDPLDENILNDKTCSIISVDFWHDVGIKEITSPVGKGSAALDWLYYDDGSCENSLGLTAGGTLHEVIALTPDELGAYNGYAITEVQVMHGCALYGEQPLENYYVWMYTGTTHPTDPDTEATVVATGSHEGSDWVTIDVDDYAFSPTDTVWIGVAWEHSSGSYPCGFDTSGYVAGKSGWLYLSGSWYELYQIGYPGNFMVRAGVDKTTGPPKPDVYIPCGEQDLTVVVENLGTFQENDCTVYWELWEWVTDPLVPTLAASGSVGDIDLAPGATEEIALGTYDFTTAGIYALIIWIVPAGADCDEDNNLVTLGIGVDCCPPETTYTLTPATPNGQNNWYTSDVTVKLTAVDPPCPDPCVNGVISGIDKIYYKLNGVEGTINGASGTFKITTDGNNLVEYWAVDNVGNTEVHHTFTVALDKTKPTVELVFEAYQDDSGNWKVDFTALAADATSGVNKVEFKKGTTLLTTITGAGPYKYTYTWTEGDGTATFYAYVYDNAGNSNSDSVVVGPLAKNLNIQGQGLAKTLPKVLVESK